MREKILKIERVTKFYLGFFFCEMLKIQRHGLWSSRSWKYLKKNGEEGGNFQKVYYFPHQFVSLVVDDQSAQSVSIHVSTLDFK